MSTRRTHYVTTTDGVTIGATVHGEGPPLVLLHGAMGDGDLDWRALLPHLTDRFTCHLPSMRGRGLSGDHPDLGPGRVVDDFVGYVDSLREPTGLVGWAAGADWSLAVAAQSSAVTAVAVYEPVANGLMDAQERAALGDAVGRMGRLAQDGDLPGAMRAFAGYSFSDQDIATAAEAGYFEATGRYVPNLLKHLRQLVEHEGTLPDDPAVLGAIQVPVLVLLGTDTRQPFFAAGARHVAEHLSNARMQEVPGAGRAAVLTRPETLAEALVEFFSPR